MHKSWLIKNPRKQGFTLIELSIVLVIIGLIVGGVLVGRDLIHAAEIRATIKQIEQLDAAVNTFRLKYNGLPGDLTNASQFGLKNYSGVNDATANGDGNGQINWFSSNNSNNEDLNALYQLKQASLLTDPFIIGPTMSEPELPLKLAASTLWNSYPATIFIEYNNGTGATNLAVGKAGNYYMISNYDDLILSNDTYAGVLLASDAFAIDSKMDDGLPLSGRVLATSSVNAPTQVPVDNVSANISMTFNVDGTSDAGADLCITDSPYKYGVLNSGTSGGSLCALMIKASF